MAAPLPADLWPEVKPDAARRLMAAAVDSFAQRGFHATTTRDIAMAAGMSPAALYVHFPSKAALLAAISHSGHLKALDMVRGTADPATGADPVVRMRRLVHDFTVWHATHHRVARVVQYELGALSTEDFQEIAELRTGTERVVRALITEGVSAGRFVVTDVRIAARAVLSLSVDVARWYTDTNRLSPAMLGDQYAELVLRMLGAVQV